MADAFKKPAFDFDDDVNAALDRATGKTGVQDLSLKRHWDADLEAELAQALEGFDAEEMATKTPRTRAEDRAHVPKGARGQESTPGPREGKVVSIRGKSVFVDLGAKSEGVVPVEQFEGATPSIGDMIEVVVDHFDTDEGILILSLKGATVDANWENLHKGMVVEARVVKTNKGGLEVEVNGIRGFMPIGQITLTRVEDASDVHWSKAPCALSPEVNTRWARRIWSSPPAS